MIILRFRIINAHCKVTSLDVAEHFAAHIRQLVVNIGSGAFGCATVAVATDVVQVQGAPGVNGFGQRVNVRVATLPGQYCSQSVQHGIGRLYFLKVAEQAHPHGTRIGGTKMGTDDVVATTPTFIQYTIGIDEVIVRYIAIQAGVDVKIPNAQDYLCPVAGGVHPCRMVYDQVGNRGIPRRWTSAWRAPGIPRDH